MKKLHLVFLIIIGMSTNFWAQSEKAVPILHPSTPIEIQISKDLRKVYVHKVTSKQTLYSISRLFEIPIAYLRKINNLDKDVGVSIGQELFIPIRDNLIITKRPKDLEKYTMLTYNVRPKETIFRIARIYFDQQIETIKENNNLSELKLDIGQELTIGWFRIDGTYNTAESELDGAVFVKTIEDQAVETDTSFLAPVPNYHRGIALWNRDSQTNQLFVLHKTAQIESMIELYNPVQDSRTTAKVVGHIPPNTYPEDIDVILSPATARELGALDSRFLVEMKYFE